MPHTGDRALASRTHFSLQLLSVTFVKCPVHHKPEMATSLGGTGAPWEPQEAPTHSTSSQPQPKPLGPWGLGAF